MCSHYDTINKKDAQNNVCIIFCGPESVAESQRITTHAHTPLTSKTKIILV